jgi:hypothetical protein
MERINILLSYNLKDESYSQNIFHTQENKYGSYLINQYSYEVMFCWEIDIDILLFPAGCRSWQGRELK